MKLSIVIVNYNVRYFLEQTLLSVFKSTTYFKYEVIVVDNNSSDDSVDMLSVKFPTITVIANTENYGFSKANNQAIRASGGEYVLLLNPDTLIQENTLQKCIDFMESNENAGGLGVKMVDGTGAFLPESKRGFPSPLAAFSKMSGLSKLFPNSKIFGKYHLSYLSKNETNKIDVISGAFMLLRKKVLDEIGFLDEDYFMYGEDIDLSYRIKKAGYENYYLADSTIIHFKGESTKKGSLNYVRVFYNAMIIFSKKHVSGASGKLLSVLLHLAIYIRAFLAVLQKIAERIGAPIVDILLMAINLYILHLFWENYIKSNDHIVFPATFFYINVPLYLIAWVFALWLNGVYDNNAKWLRLLFGLTSGTILIATMYAFFPDFLRTSRGVILVGYVVNFIVLFLIRIIYKATTGKVSDYFSDNKNMVIVGPKNQADKVWNFLQTTGLNRNYIGYLTDSHSDNSNEKYLGDHQQLSEIAKLFQLQEIIFCADTISVKNIIEEMRKIGSGVTYKIASENAEAIIGSNSRNTSGDLYTFDIGFNLNKPLYRRFKRIFDILIALTGIFTYPILVFFVKKEVVFFSQCFSVLSNKKTWIGYDEKFILAHQLKLPLIRKSVIAVSDNFQTKNDSLLEKLHIIYAKKYTPVKDLQILIQRLFF